MKRSGLSLKWVVIWSLREGAGPGATGGFDRQAWEPIESLLSRQRTNQRPRIHEAAGASVCARWTSSIMCGRPNGTEYGSTEYGSTGLQPRTASSAALKSVSPVSDKQLRAKLMKLLLLRTGNGARWSLKAKQSKLSVVLIKKKRDLIKGMWAQSPTDTSRTSPEARERAPRLTAR